MQKLLFVHELTTACTAAFCAVVREHSSTAKSSGVAGRSAIIMGPIVPVHQSKKASSGTVSTICCDNDAHVRAAALTNCAHHKKEDPGKRLAVDDHSVNREANTLTVQPPPCQRREAELLESHGMVLSPSVLERQRSLEHLKLLVRLYVHCSLALLV